MPLDAKPTTIIAGDDRVTCPSSATMFLCFPIPPSARSSSRKRFGSPGGGLWTYASVLASPFCDMMSKACGDVMRAANRLELCAEHGSVELLAHALTGIDLKCRDLEHRGVPPAIHDKRNDRQHCHNADNRSSSSRSRGRSRTAGGSTVVGDCSCGAIRLFVGRCCVRWELRRCGFKSGRRGGR